MLTISSRLNLPEDNIMEALYQYARRHRGAIPGVINSVTNSPNVYGVTADIDICLDEPMIDPTTGKAVNIKIPTLPQVKVATLGGGGFFITLPIAAGDECMLIFQDMCLDSAWQSGGINNIEMDRRRHDLSDAICLPLRWTQKNQLSNISNTSLQLRSLNGTTYIDLTGGQVTLHSTDIQMGTGTQQAFMTEAFLNYYTSQIYPFLVSKGFAGGVAPTNSSTVNTTGS